MKPSNDSPAPAASHRLNGSGFEPTSPSVPYNHPLQLDHMLRLTDCFGIIQHANHALPEYRSGYTTDDNARALVVAVKYHHLYRDAISRDLATRYLACLRFTQRDDGRFHNCVGYDRTFLDEVGSEDAFGRAFWALACTLQAPPQPGLVGPAERMFHLAIPWVGRMEHPRARALCIAALYWWSRAETGDARRAGETARPLADYLASRYREHSHSGWDWILPELTYANAKLPEALFRAHQMTGEEEYLRVAQNALRFLYERTFIKSEGRREDDAMALPQVGNLWQPWGKGDSDQGDILCLVGNDGWCSSDACEPPIYDQQPVDATAMVEASLAAFEATREMEYLRRAWLSYQWFFGRNVLGESLYDPETGGCFDALTPCGVNQNRGAESTISLLSAHSLLAEARQEISLGLLTGNPVSSLSLPGQACCTQA